MTIDTPLPSRVAELRGAGTRPVQLPATQAARQLLDSIADGTGSGVEEHIRRAFALKAFESLTAALLPDRMPLDDVRERFAERRRAHVDRDPNHGPPPCLP